MKNYLLRGPVARYVGDNWKKSKESDWTTDIIDWTSVRVAGKKKVGHYLLTVYACRDCPHTFYGDSPPSVLKAHGYMRDN